MLDNSIGFEIIGYSYDPNSQDLRLVGKNVLIDDCSIETVIHNPSQSMLTHIIGVYSKTNPESCRTIDISFIN